MFYSRRIKVYSNIIDDQNKLLFEKEQQLTKAIGIIKSLLPFEHVIDPYALTSDIEENKVRFHEPFEKAKRFLKECEENE